MATSTIKPVHAGIDFGFTIAASNWSSSSPYTYTWSNTAVTAGCRVEVEFASTSENTESAYISFEKVSGGGGVTFTSPVKPTTGTSVIVHVINAQTGNIVTNTDTNITSTAISGCANVNEALTNLSSGTIIKNTETSNIIKLGKVVIVNYSENIQTSANGWVTVETGLPIPVNALSTLNIFPTHNGFTYYNSSAYVDESGNLKCITYGSSSYVSVLTNFSFLIVYVSI